MKIVAQKILDEMKEVWPNEEDRQKVLNYFEKKEKELLEHYDTMPEHLKKKMPKNYWKKELFKRIKLRKVLLDYEKSVVSKIIPKDQLEDGVVYLPLEGTEGLRRHVDEAKWDSKLQMFKYMRTKFGHTFEDTMHHFADVVNENIAGFTPIKKKDNE